MPFLYSFTHQNYSCLNEASLTLDKHNLALWTTPSNYKWWQIEIFALQEGFCARIFCVRETIFLQPYNSHTLVIVFLRPKIDCSSQGRKIYEHCQDKNVNAQRNFITISPTTIFFSNNKRFYYGLLCKSRWEKHWVHCLIWW